jgi:hypothetical protein
MENRDFAAKGVVLYIVGVRTGRLEKIPKMASNSVGVSMVLQTQHKWREERFVQSSLVGGCKATLWTMSKV